MPQQRSLQWVLSMTTVTIRGILGQGAYRGLFRPSKRTQIPVTAKLRVEVGFLQAWLWLPISLGSSDECWQGV